MEEFTKWLIAVYQSYGFRAVIVVFLTILLTNITKAPIIKKAQDHARAYNVDKSVVTKWIALLPYGYAIVLNVVFVVILAAIHHDWNIDWGKAIGNGALFASISIAGFEIGKKCLESYVSKKTANGGK